MNLQTDWREQLRTAFAEKNEGKPAERVYRFGSLEELTAENFLFEPLFRCCHHEDRVPLVKRSIESAAHQGLLPRLQAELL